MQRIVTSLSYFLVLGLICGSLIALQQRSDNGFAVCLMLLMALLATAGISDVDS